MRFITGRHQVLSHAKEREGDAHLLELSTVRPGFARFHPR